MYEAYWELERKPFGSGCETSLYYPGDAHQATLLKLRYAVESRHGAALVTGHSGVGKTLVTRLLAERLPQDCGPWVHLTYPQMPTANLLAYLAHELQTPGLSVQLRLTGPNTGIVDFQRCYYWTGEAGKPRVFVDYNDSTPPYVTKTTFAGTTKISGTITEVDPGVDATGRPLAGSPLRGLAPTAGLTRDAAGVYRDVMSAIGAYEYVNPRPPRSRS